MEIVSFMETKLNRESIEFREERNRTRRFTALIQKFIHVIQRSDGKFLKLSSLFRVQNKSTGMLSIDDFFFKFIKNIDTKWLHGKI